MSDKALISAVCLALGLPACNFSHESAQGTWTVQVSATSGSALILTVRSQEILRVACRRQPNDLFVWFYRNVPAEGPVALQIGQEIFGLIHEPDAPELVAAGAISRQFPNAIRSGQPLGIRRGTAVIFTSPSLPVAIARDFGSSCERLYRAS